MLIFKFHHFVLLLIQFTHIDKHLYIWVIDLWLIMPFIFFIMHANRMLTKWFSLHKIFTFMYVGMMCVNVVEKVPFKHLVYKEVQGYVTIFGQICVKNCVHSYKGLWKLVRFDHPYSIPNLRLSLVIKIQSQLSSFFLLWNLNPLFIVMLLVLSNILKTYQNFISVFKRHVMKYNFLFTNGGIFC